MTRSRRSTVVGWIGDYTPRSRVYTVSRRTTIDEVWIRPEAVLEDGNVDDYWQAKNQPPFILSRDDALMRKVFGAHIEGESRDLLFLAEPSKLLWDAESQTPEELREIRKRLVQEAMTIDLQDDDELAAFAARYGSFTGHWIHNRQYSGVQNQYLLLFEEPVMEDGCLMPLAGVEPLWYLARRLALLRTAKQLETAIRCYDVGAVQDMVTDVEQPGGIERTRGWWRVWFRGKDIPDPVCLGLRQGNHQPRAVLTFEPAKSQHFMIAARMVLTRLLNDALEDGITVELQHYLRPSEVAALRKADPDIPRHMLYREPRCVEGEKPPLFAVTYAVRTPEQLAYTDLMTRRALAAKEPKWCPICHEPLLQRDSKGNPLHANQRYCERHTDTEKRQHRRKEERRRKAA